MESDKNNGEDDEGTCMKKLRVLALLVFVIMRAYPIFDVLVGYSGVIEIVNDSSHIVRVNEKILFPSARCEVWADELPDFFSFKSPRERLVNRILKNIFVIDLAEIDDRVYEVRKERSLEEVAGESRFKELVRGVIEQLSLYEREYRPLSSPVKARVYISELLEEME